MNVFASICLVLAEVREGIESPGAGVTIVGYHVDTENLVSLRGNKCWKPLSLLQPLTYSLIGLKSNALFTERQYYSCKRLASLENV